MMQVQTTAVGAPLAELITLGYIARQSLLLEGKHGIGKSEILVQVAHELGITPLVVDLSLYEAPDLVGLPVIGADGRTHHAVPAFWPSAGAGLLIFEELNRVPRHVQTPVLQLLTTRRLNDDYVLPEDWVACAAINNAADGYLVDDLDPALLSRFLRVHVVPDIGHWLGWARGKGGIHPKIIAFAEATPQLFEDPVSNPRAWARASGWLSAWERRPGSQDALVAGLAGWVGGTWALGFLQFYTGARTPLRPEQVIEDYAAHRSVVCHWMQEGQLDLLMVTLEQLKRYIQPQRIYDHLVSDPTRVGHVKAFLADLPADLRRQAEAWLEDRGFIALLGTPPSGKKGRQR